MFIVTNTETRNGKNHCPLILLNVTLMCSYEVLHFTALEDIFRWNFKIKLTTNLAVCAFSCGRTIMTIMMDGGSYLDVFPPEYSFKQYPQMIYCHIIV